MAMDSMTGTTAFQSNQVHVPYVAMRSGAERNEVKERNWPSLDRIFVQNAKCLLASESEDPVFNHSQVSTHEISFRQTDGRQKESSVGEVDNGFDTSMGYAVR